MRFLVKAMCYVGVASTSFLIRGAPATNTPSDAPSDQDAQAAQEVQVAEDVWYYTFANLTPALENGQILIPGQMGAADSQFRPWRNIVLHRNAAPSFRAVIHGIPFVYPGEAAFGPAVDPPLRLLHVAAREGDAEHYRLGVYIEARRSRSGVFFAFDAIGISAATYLDERERVPPLVVMINVREVEVVSIPTPPQYASTARRLALLSKPGVTEIPIGAEITITAAPYMLKLQRE